MNVNLPTVWTIFCNEMRMVLRNRKAVILAIVMPMIVMPIMLGGTRWSIKKQESQLKDSTFRYAITGSQSNAVGAIMTATLQHLAAHTNHPPKLTEKRESNPRAALAGGNLELVIEGLTLAEALASETNSDVFLDEDRLPLQKVRPGASPPLVVRLAFRGNRHESVGALQAVQDAFIETRNDQRAALFRNRGLKIMPDQVAALSSADVSVPGKVAGLSLGRNLSVMLLFFALVGGSMISIDMLAGEKERGTLETLLTSSTGRVEIIMAKHLAIMAVALVTIVVQATSILAMANFKLVPLPEGIAQALSPGIVLLLIVLYVPVVALVAEVLLLISGYAKDYKQAQIWLTPVLLIGILPATAPYLPGTTLHSAIILVPIANIAIAVKEILSGNWEWWSVCVAWLVTAAVAAWMIRMNVRVLSTEKLITAADTDAAEHLGGLALYERRLWIWFGTMWGLLVIYSNYTTYLDLRIQILVNMVGFFLLADMLMIRTYRLDIRSTLSLRTPPGSAWLAVLVGVPGGILTGVGIARLANYVIPIPTKVIESFSQSVAPEQIPFPQLVFFLAVMPAIFEEITFRGMLLHGLRRRFKPAVAVLIVGLVFGFFHMALFRLAPTAFLGVLLASVTMLTGSIFPAMLWHALNNAFGVAAYRWNIAISEMDGALYLAGPILLICAFWILWRNRPR